MVERQTFDFVQRQQNFNQKLFMFRLQWQGKAVNDAERLKMKAWLSYAYKIYENANSPAKYF